MIIASEDQLMLGVLEKESRLKWFGRFQRRHCWKEGWIMRAHIHTLMAGTDKLPEVFTNIFNLSEIIQGP